MPQDNTVFSIPRTPAPNSIAPTTPPPKPAASPIVTYTQPAAFGGIGIGGMLFIIFLVLKLAQVKPFGNWSYWRVTAPLWIPFALAFFVLVIFKIVDR